MLVTKAYAAQYAGSLLTPYSVERRDPGRHDVVIDISHCGVCHTDIHFVHNDFGMSLYPMVPGHEIVGKVTAVGNDVKKFRPGDTVGVGCLVDSCRECEWCANGLEQHCQNGWVLIGGLPETQEMLDYCAAHTITADVEVIPVQQINAAYERILKNDVKYRFVIDTASLK